MNAPHKIEVEVRVTDAEGNELMTNFVESDGPLFQFDINGRTSSQHSEQTGPMLSESITISWLSK